jgi:cysteine desulfurase
MRKIKNNKRIYLDYAATTPLDLAVKRAMEPYFSEKFGNPGSLHWLGQEASAAVFEARRQIASAVGVDYKNIIFTGSATEANNLALRGVVKGMMNNEYGIKNKNFQIHNSKFIIPKVIVSAIEHESILTTARDLEGEGIEIVVIPVDKEGTVNLKKLAAALDERTVLISVMYANNEVGTIQPISKIAEIVSDFRKQMANGKWQMAGEKSIGHKPYAISPWPLLHTDAVQAFQYLNCNMNELGVDLMTISAHKIYGPKGVGALCAREGLRVQGLGVRENEYIKTLNAKRSTLYPQTTGGGQEWGMRSGTENVPNIVGFGKAVELAAKRRAQSANGVRALRDYLWVGIKKIYPSATINGSTDNRLPNNLNIYFPGKKAEELLIALDLVGVAVSAGAACSARSLEPSYVLEAMGFDHERCSGSLRFTLGKFTKKIEITNALKILKKIFKL